LLSKCQPIDYQLSSPLLGSAKENIFKLFLFDIGLLGNMLGLSYKEHRDQGYNYKGCIAEILYKMSLWKNMVIQPIHGNMLEVKLNFYISMILEAFSNRSEKW